MDEYDHQMEKAKARLREALAQLGGVQWLYLPVAVAAALIFWGLL